MEPTKDVLRAEIGLVTHLLAGVDVVPYILIVRSARTLVPRLRPTHVVVQILILDREGNFTHGAQLANFPLLVGRIVAV